MDIEDYAREHPQLDEGDTAAHVPSLVRGAFAALQAEDVLDVGCGEGRFLASLAAGSSARMVGVDLSPTRVALARERGIDASVGTADKLDFPDESFDLVICCHVIEHVEDQLAVARELARVTRTDGLVYIGAPLRLRGAWYPYRLPNGGWGLDPTHVREYGSPTQLADVCVEAGMTVLELDTSSLTFPVSHLAQRAVALATKGVDSSKLNALPGRVHIPRYRTLHLLARPRETP